MKTIFQILIISFLVASMTATANVGNDTDIYFPVDSGTSNQNVLFVMDVSGSMRREVGNTGVNRFQAMKEAFSSILQSTPEGVNVGLMNFGSIGSERNNFAQGVKFPIKPLIASARDIVEQGLPTNNDGSVNWNANNIPEPIGAITVFDYLPEVVNSWSPQGWTPIVGSLYEAGLYFRGEKVGWGLGPLEETGNEWVAHPSTYIGAPGGWDATVCNTIWTERLPQGVIPGEYRCPADIDNPSASAGSYANCAATEAQCLAAPSGGGGGDIDPITVGNSSFGEDDDGSLSFTHTLASGSNRVVVVGVAIETRDSNASVDSITYGGVNMTPIAGSKHFYDYGYANMTQLFYVRESDLPNDGNNTVSISHDGEEILAGAVTLNNVDQSGPEAVASNHEYEPSTLSTSITTLTDNAILIDVVSGGNSLPRGALEAQSAQTELWYDGSDGSQGGMSTRLVSNAGSYNMDWDWSPTGSSELIRGVQSVTAFFPASSTSTSLNITISSQSDDAEEKNNGNMKLDSSDLDLGDRIVGLRFTDIDVPQGATITAAYIQFSVDTSNGSDNGATQYTIQGEAKDNPLTFTNSNSNISIRPRTTATEYWNPPNWSNSEERGSDQKTNDLSSIVQELVNRSGWNTGQPMAFIFSTGSEKRDADTIEAGSANAPTLHIEYATTTAVYPEAQYIKFESLSAYDNDPWAVASELSLIDANDASLNKGAWSLFSTDSEETNPSRPATNAFDGNDTTFWHTEWRDSDPVHPHEIIINLGALHSLKTFKYLARQDGSDNGRVNAYKIYLSNDGVSWGDAIISDNFADTNAEQTVDFPITTVSNSGSGSGSGSGTGSNVVVCHIPADNPDNAHTLIIPVSDRPLHEAHGDLLGACGTGISSAGSVAGTCLYTMCSGAAVSEPTYVSPIESACQSNTIILLSDGSPQAGSSVDVNATYDKIVTNNEWVNPLATAFRGLSCDGAGQNDNGNDYDIGSLPRGTCGPELTHFLATNDNSTALEGDQFIQTYTVGLGLGQGSAAENYLKALSTVDDPNTTGVVEGYFSASNQATLITAFSTILSELQVLEDTTTSFSNPGYSIVSKTGLNHEDTLFIPVFEVTDNVVWKGNLKKFKIVNISGKRRIQGKEDQNGARHNAVTDKGALTDEAHDLWSTSITPEGTDVVGGGAAALLNPAVRNLYSDLVCTSGSECVLTANVNALSIDNISTNNGNGSGINNADLGLQDGSINDRKKYICFIRGYETYDVSTQSCTGNARKHMGDMLHFAPVGVTYHFNHDDGDDSTRNRQVIFAGTNEGYLHAIDTESGEEIFAFMPKELLKNIKPQFDDNEYRGHRFGIDGIATVWITDHNDNGIIEGAISATESTSAYPADQVYLYFGLRRGGSTYYALDVTNPAHPKLKWKIQGGGNGNFQHLGQSWSRPYLALLNKEITGATGNITTEQLEVLIFSGGYDAVNQDKNLADRDASDSVGNDVFIVNAKTGEFIWSLKKGTGNATITGSSALTHSVPGGVRLIDMDKDGAIDRMYFADVIGKVWRLELAADLDQSKLVPFADLGGGSDTVEPRKFFNEPDVSLTRKDGNVSLLVSIGSGDRTDPLGKTTTDRFYVLIDRVIRGERAAADMIEDADLAAIEMGVDAEGARTLSDPLNSKSVLASDNIDKLGWYLEFGGGGEKVIADSLTNRGKVIFNTLVPDIYANLTPTITTCNVPAIQGRAYILDILEGKAAFDFNESGDLDNDDLFSVISANEIPGGVQLIFNEPLAKDGSACTADDCVQNVDLRTGKKLSQIMSYNAGVLESVYWTKPQEK